MKTNDFLIDKLIRWIIFNPGWTCVIYILSIIIIDLIIIITELFSRNTLIPITLLLSDVCSIILLIFVKSDIGDKYWTEKREYDNFTKYQFDYINKNGV